MNELETEYLNRIVNDTGAATEVDVNYPQDITWARLWLQVKPYGIVYITGWDNQDQVERFAKKCKARLDWNNGFFLVAKTKKDKSICEICGRFISPRFPVHICKE